MMALLDESKKSNFFPDQYNWYQLEEACPACALPLHMASGQEVAFCPNCAIDVKNAYNGRCMLALAKARDLQQRLWNGEAPGGAFGAGQPL
jgi:hypothetical protein